MEWIVSIISAAALLAGTFYGWTKGKAILNYVDEPQRRLEWQPSEEEWTTARLRRARTERYRAEHAEWDRQFSPHEADRCPVCSGRRDRTRRSAAF
jgi:hypothetical protein